MTYAGAEGATESEIAQALRFGLPEPALHAAFNSTARALDQRSEQLAPDSSGDGFELSIVNQAWGQQGYPFLESYLDVLAQHYDSGLFAVDFGESEAVRQLINGWVEDQTAQRIKDLLPEGSLTVDTRLVLTNAIYFKASWLSEFDPDLTEDGSFQAPAGERQVSMMQQQLDALYVDGENYQALELPYVSPDVRMLFILPDEGAFSEVSAKLDASFFSEVQDGMTTHTTTVTLPRFEFESENQLKGALSSLGMPGAFTADANFDGLAGGVEPLWIDQVYHKAFVALDEQGTEAAAATAVVISTESAKPVAEISFDRPFLFSIYDKPTGQILFLGQLVDPS
jgi:serpin B